MKIAVISDLHVENHRVLPGPVQSGVNQRCRHAAAAVRAVPKALSHAKQRGVEAVVVTGDVFDCARPEPAVLAEAADALATYPCPVYLLPGNHERSSDAPGHHALSALRQSKNCVVVDEPCVVLSASIAGGLLLVPFVTDAADCIGALVAEHRPAYAFCHVGLIADDSPPWLKQGDRLPVELVRSWCEQFKLRGLFAGDFHAHRVHSAAPPIVQVGALCQADFADPADATGFVTVLDVKAASVKALPIPRPVFRTVAAEPIATVRHRVAALTPFNEGPASERPAPVLYLSVECSLDARLGVQATLSELQASYDTIGGELHYRFTDPEVALVEQPAPQPDAPPPVTAAEAVAAFCAREAGEDEALASRATHLAQEVLS